MSGFPKCACGHDIYAHGGAAHEFRPCNPCHRCDCQLFGTAFRIEGDWRNTVTNGPPTLMSVTAREIALQSAAHYE